MSWDYHDPCPTCGVRVDPWVHDCPVYGDQDQEDE